MKTPPIVTPQEWEAARQQLLVKEKEVTRARDALAAERRRMPWVAVNKDYAFDGPEGRASLLSPRKKIPPPTRTGAWLESTLAPRIMEIDGERYYDVVVLETRPPDRKERT